MINVQVEKNANENGLSLLKRFTRKVQSSGVIVSVRSNRYSERQPSEYTKKKRALKSIARREKINELIKLGKITEKPARQ
ncbi:MAG: 30S ribosomal protein S21 [Patescibacteria group bacterium]